MTRARIDYLVSRFPRTSETFIVREIDALDRSGTRIGTIRSLFSSPDTTVHPVAVRWVDRVWRPGIRQAGGGLVWALRTHPGRLARLLAEVTKDFYRSPGMFLRALATIAVATAHARQLSRTPDVHVHAHYATFPLLAAWACHRLAGVTYSVTTHAHDIYVDTSGLARRCAEAEFVVAISRHNLELLRDQIGVTTPIELVHCGIDTATYPFRPRRLPRSGPIRALCVASLQEYKGHRFLFEAMAAGCPAVRRLELELIGDGPLRAELSALAVELGIADRVRFRGARPESEVAAALEAADLFVLPSVVAIDGQMEGLPVALMESLACGVPTVSTRLSGIGEIVVDGETGLLCRPGDAADLARAIERMATDPDGVERMSRAGRDLVCAQFELDGSVAALSRLFAGAGEPAGVAETAEDAEPARVAQSAGAAESTATPATTMLRPWLVYALAVVGHYLGVDALIRRAGGPGLVLLMFHRFSDAPDPHPITVRPVTFQRIATWCRARGVLVDLDTGLRALDERWPGTRYAVTVDDGYRDNLEPLACLGAPVPATLYVATGHIGGDTLWPYALSDAVARSPHRSVDLELLGPGTVHLDSPGRRQVALERLVAALKTVPYADFATTLSGVLATLDADVPPRIGDMLTWDQVRRLHRLGVEIGAHTVHHPILANADDRAAAAEIRGSRDHLAAALGTPPRHFAYPNGGAGDFLERDVATIVDAGFSSAVTTVEGVNRVTTDRFRLLRVNMHEGRFRTPAGRLSRALFFSETSGVVAWARRRAGAAADLAGSATAPDES
ncbi:glycosyltransferase [Dietzia cercidiphylli]|uniref:glycosyltransferase n=1 Tax=Dietzia cercidiphylli TaxID=498199 RepID=UPI003F7CEA9F